MLPGNKYRAILQVSSINFDLKNAEEQEVIISLYENFFKLSQISNSDCHSDPDNGLG